MKRMPRLSFVSRVILCMALSLALNTFVGHKLKDSLSQGNYTVFVKATYPLEGKMQLLYDTGNSFNTAQQVGATMHEGENILQFPLQIKVGEQLKYLRLDFGSNINIKNITLHSVELVNKEKTLFRLENKDMEKKIGLLVNILDVEKSTATFTLDTAKVPFDPYIVFDPVNELIYPKWQRILFLVLPWLVLFFLPLLDWIKKVNAQHAYGLFFVGLFFAAVPLKIAWVTFTTLLLLAYALFRFFKKRRFQFGTIQISLLLFFVVPLLFLGAGEVSKLAIPLGFVLFVLISSILDFSDLTVQIKKIYTTVFFITMSIALVSWLLLMLYNGYYYQLDWANYFVDIKSNAHATMYWLYYSHTTFLSFFILIGALFCFDLYEQGKITKTFGLLYALFTMCIVVLLGSRFALILGLALPFLYLVSVKKLSRWLLPIWITVFTVITYFIGTLDVQREQLWKIAWTTFKQKIWLGHGTGTSDVVLPNHLLIKKGGVETLMEVNHSHNQFLTYLVENGLLGALLFLASFLLLFYHFAKQENKTMILLSFMVLMLMIIESPLRTTTSLYVIAFLLSVLSLPPAGLPKQ